MASVTTHAKTQSPATHAGWASNFPPRPIRTRAAHKAALDELMRLGRLMDAGKADKAETDALEVLKLLVVDYEKRRFGDIASGVAPLEKLRYLVEESGLTASDLGRLLGDRALGSRILSGERELSKAISAASPSIFALIRAISFEARAGHGQFP